MFLDNFLIAAEQVAILYILVAVGFIADRTKLFTEKAARLCTDLMFYIITPAKIVQSFISMEFSRESATRLAIAAACGAAIHIIGVAVSSVVFNKSPIGKAAIFKYSSVYGNCGYMALPLAYAVLGDEGVFYGSVVIMMFHLFSFTHGIWLMSRSETGEKTKFNFKNILINPGTISLIIGLPLYLLKIRLPNVIEAPIDYLAALNTPVAMLIFGTYLSNAKIKSALKEWRILCVALIKLAVIPLICLGVFRLCGITGMAKGGSGDVLAGITGALLTAMIIAASAPPANITVVFAAKYNKDTGLASQTVAIVSFISIVTMPLLIGLASTM